MKIDNGPSLFPLGHSSPRACLAAFGGFDNDQVALIMGSQAEMYELTHPVGHLLAYNENPYFAGLKSELGPYTENLPNVRVYRAGVCIGSSIMQRRINELSVDGYNAPELRTDPNRHYLAYPEDATANAFFYYYLTMIPARYDELYLNPSVERTYFSGQESIEQTQKLGDVWGKKGMKVLLEGISRPEDPFVRDTLTEVMFEQICRGIFHTFRLYRMLEHEVHVAPWDEIVYDSERHILTGSTSTEGGRRLFNPSGTRLSTLELRNYRRPVGGYVSRTGVGLAEHLGDTRIPGSRQAATYVEAVSSGIAGYVQREAHDPSSLVKVVFRDSLKTQDVRPSDKLVYKEGDQHRWMAGGESLPDDGPIELQALVRGSQATMLHFPDRGKIPEEGLRKIMDRLTSKDSGSN